MYQRKYDFKAGTKISSDQIDEEFNQLIAALNEVSSGGSGGGEGQQSKITADDGGAKFNLTLTSDDILQELVLRGQGFYTFYVVGGSKNLPPTNKAIRGIAHMTTPDAGWVKVIDTLNNTFTNYYENGSWTGWSKLLNDSGIVSTPKQSQTSLTRTLTIGMTSSGVDYKIYFDKVDIDVQGEMTNSVFKAKESGFYLINAWGAYSQTIPNNAYVKMYKNGAFSATLGGIKDQQLITANYVVYLQAGASYDFYLVQNSGASQTCNTITINMVKLT